MKKYLLKSILGISTVLIFTHSSHAQGLAVNTDGSTADASAMLDVKSGNKGVLVPRMASTSSITSPVTGLLVYQTAAPAGFYYYDGASWLLLQNSAAVVSSSNGGAGTVNGILKANGSGTVSAAVAGTDYLAPTGSAAALTNFPTLNQNTTGNAATVTTNADLTGDVTSSGNATTIANTSTGGGHIINAINNASTTGTINAARLGTGASATTFLNGAGAFIAPIVLTTTGSGAATISHDTLNVPTPGSGGGGSTVDLVATLTSASTTKTLATGGSTTTASVLNLDNSEITPSLAGSSWDGTKYTVGVTGNYLITVTATMTNTGPVAWPSLVVSPGITYYGCGSVNGNIAAPLSRSLLSIVLHLAAGTTFQVFMQNSSPTLAGTFSTDGSTQLSVVKL